MNAFKYNEKMKINQISIDFSCIQVIDEIQEKTGLDEWSLQLLDYQGNKIRNQNDERWTQQFKKFLRFAAENGHCDVLQRYDKDKSLGMWVTNQRKRRKKGKLSNERIALLDSVGFKWENRNKN